MISFTGISPKTPPVNPTFESDSKLFAAFASSSFAPERRSVATTRLFGRGQRVLGDDGTPQPVLRLSEGHDALCREPVLQTRMAATGLGHGNHEVAGTPRATEWIRRSPCGGWAQEPTGVAFLGPRGLRPCDMHHGE